jgi:hypothetical protein
MNLNLEVNRAGRSSRFALLVISILSLVVVSACGSDGESDSRFSKVQADSVIRDLGSFDFARFKKAKTYDVDELPGAVAAYMGYYKPAGSEPVQYELRMYPDHATAIAIGVTYAKEVTGADALLRSVDVRWEEGTKDRRGGGAFSDGLTPLYGDFAVFGNVIMLCEGRDSIQSLDRCEALLEGAGIITAE